MHIKSLICIVSLAKNVKFHWSIIYMFGYNTSQDNTKSKLGLEYC